MSHTTRITVNITDLGILGEVALGFGAELDMSFPQNTGYYRREGHRADLTHKSVKWAPVHVCENQDKSFRFEWDEDYTNQLWDIYGVGFENLLGAYNAQSVINLCSANGRMFSHVGQRQSVMDKLEVLGGELPAGVTEADIERAQVVQVYV